MIFWNSVAASGRLPCSAAERAVSSARFPNSSLRRALDVTIHATSAIRATAPARIARTRWLGMREPGADTVGGAVVGSCFGLGSTVVGMRILQGCRDRDSALNRNIPAGLSEAAGGDLCSAPGATRTPGQRFRKPLLYPPELRGLVRRNKDPARSHGKQRLHVVRKERTPPERRDLQEERAALECGAGPPHQGHGRGGGAPRGEHIVDDQHARPGWERVLVHV